MMLLGLATALAEPSDLEARLLGDDAVTPVAQASAQPASTGWLGLVLAAGALGVGAWLWRRDLMPASPEGSVRLVGKHALPGGPVVLVDVDGLDGTTHRLLLGPGAGGLHVLADVTVGVLPFVADSEGAIVSTLFRSVALWSLLAAPALAGTSLEVAAEGDATGAAVRLLVAMTALAILPGLLLVMTPFTRFIIVFSLLRQALGLQQSPPNQVLIGMAVVLTLVSMRPTLEAVQRDAVVPYMEGQVTAVEAYDGFIGPMRTFMFRNTNRQDLRTAMRIGRLETRPKSLDDIPTSSVITGFVLSELRTAFTIAIKVYLPFLVVDIVVASVLLGMGMMMLPPVVISLPFKLMVFVLMDGWGLLVVGLVDGVK